MGANDFLSNIAPGQQGTLHQGEGHWREVRCVRVFEDSLQLSVVEGRGDGALSIFSTAYFQTIVEGGVLRVEGSLDSPDPGNATLGYRFTPSDKPIQKVNRRETFRVPVSLRGKLRGTAQGRDDTYDDEWDCSLRDISVGGARLVLKSPPPFIRSLAVLRVTFQTEEQPIILPCKIIQTQPGKNPAPMDATVRLAFHTNSRQESMLNRYVNWAQMEMLKKGLR